MELDRRVVAKKFAHEVALLEQHRSTLQSWGCFVTRVEFPEVDIVFVPRNPVKATFAVDSPPSVGIAPPGAIALAQAQITVLSARAFGARFSLVDYDMLPPSITFHDPFSWDLLRYQDMFRAVKAEGGRGMVVLLDSHPTTKLPFLCLRGVREYHQHPQHSGDEWALYRAHSTLFSLVGTVWTVCVRNLVPHFFVPGVQVQWEAVIE